MTKEGELTAAPGKLRQEPHELDRVAEPLLGIDCDTPPIQRLALPSGGAKCRAVEPAIPNEPAVFEIAPAVFEASHQEQRRPAMIMRLVVLRLDRESSIVAFERLFALAEVQ